MRFTISLVFIAIAFQWSCTLDKQKSNIIEDPVFEFYGIEVRVDEFEKSKNFYNEKLGFRIKEISDSPRTIEFDTPEIPFFLVEVNEGSDIDYDAESRANATFQVNKLLSTIDELRSKDVHFIEDRLRRNGVGISIPFIDPSNNFHTIIEVQIREIPEFTEPVIYNTGFSISDMDLAKDFYVNTLGFKVYSENYLPSALPLKHADERFAFMLHYNPDIVRPSSVTSPDQAQTMLVFSTSSLGKAISFFINNKIGMVDHPDRGNQVYFKDPFGNISKLIEN